MAYCVVVDTLAYVLIIVFIGATEAPVKECVIERNRRILEFQVFRIFTLFTLNYCSLVLNYQTRAMHILQYIIN